MKLRTRLLLLLAIFSFEVNRVVGTFGNSAPAITDLLEVHNIGWNLAHGRGYQFDWDDPQWRLSLRPFGAEDHFDFILARRSSHPTMFRPPLTPLLVGGLIKLFPDHSFMAWRTLDCAAFSAAACLLCDMAYASGWFPALATMLMLLLFDPLLRIFVPGCWTEGIAFDLLAVLIWLFINPRCLTGRGSALVFGITLGLLCLDRAVFVLTILPLGALWAVAVWGPPIARLKMTGMALAVCLLLQAPWWIRNMSLSGRFLPLGTQGGFNLPDQYSDIALVNGSWTGQGMAIAWTPLTAKDSDIRPPKGFTQESFEQLYPGNPRVQELFAATFCGSLASEIAVSDRGTHAAHLWIRRNYQMIPQIMLLKAKTLTAYFHPMIIMSAVLTLLGFIALPQSRRCLVFSVLIAASYVLAVSLTHVVLARFLVPILPVIFLGDALGVAGMVRLIAVIIRSIHNRSIPAEETRTN